MMTVQVVANKIGQFGNVAAIQRRIHLIHHEERIATPDGKKKSQRGQRLLSARKTRHGPAKVFPV